MSNDLSLSSLDWKAVARAAGFENPLSIEPLSGGRNNRVYRVRSESGNAALKWYYADRGGERDRMQSDFLFSSFCWDHGITTVARPLLIDRANRVVLFEWIDGIPFQIGDVTKADVDAAWEFVALVCARRETERARQLLTAAEACFSIGDHGSCIDRRIAHLMTIDANTTSIHRDAQTFARQILKPTWEKVRQGLEDADPSVSRALAETERVLSPSDFGFHNAVKCNDGTVRFVDFEYAGWDDPAKLICDFFCQVEVPIPEQFRDSAIKAVAQHVTDPESFRLRCDLLLPAYQLKWASIVLNDFLPAHANRRKFNDPSSMDEARLASQLEKSRRLVARCNH